ncbi:MAG: inorganic phosphate transporter [Desulfobacterales bacterium]|nr:MAG: inorganic phosphate transporter [Desulfobacterales bacterium]
MIVFFLSSGLFLGWSLGANDASNVFGTAVGSKMIRFRTAAVYCSIFLILGAVISGAGASHTLGKLGSVNAIAGAFIVAFSAGASVYLMTKARYPVSTSQAIVGAIIGWNFFSGSLTDYDSLSKIVSTWVFCPILSAVIAIVIYKLVVFCIYTFKLHMFTQDILTRFGLLLVGAFGSYSLGANNIANVMGVFVPVSPFSDISFFGWFHLSSAQQLFFVGAVAIGVGVFTYSHKVMATVGEGIVKLSPVAAFVVVFAHSVVLFLFASQRLQGLLIQLGLPPFPLVPVSSSQAIVGAVIGVGLLKGGRGIRWRTLGGITSSWVVTPVIAAILSFISLFFLQNVFEQEVYRPVRYELTPQAVERIQKSGISLNGLESLFGREFANAARFRKVLAKQGKLTDKDYNFIIASAQIDNLIITAQGIDAIQIKWISETHKEPLRELQGKHFKHKWLLENVLAEKSALWRRRVNAPEYNANLRSSIDYICTLFRPDGG